MGPSRPKPGLLSGSDELGPRASGLDPDARAALRRRLAETAADEGADEVELVAPQAPAPRAKRRAAAEEPPTPPVGAAKVRPPRRDDRAEGAAAPARPTRSGWASVRDLVLVGACGAIVALAAVVRPYVSAGANPATPSASARAALMDLPEGAAAPSWEEPTSSTDAPLAGCAIPDKGMGPYVEVPSASPFVAKVFVPKDRIGQSDAYHLLLHFHGGEPVRKLMAIDDLDYVVATIDRGNGSSAYLGSVKDRKAWDELIAGIDEHVARAMGRNMKADDVVVSSWSAGYKAIEEMLRLAPQPPEVHGLVLLDSLHASKPIGKGQLDGFIRAGKRATSDRSFFFSMMHSAIVPDGYASTTDTANYVLTRVGAHRQEVTDGGQDLLPLRTVAQKGRFEVRGYAGADKAAHCDQLRLLSIILHRQKKPVTSAVAGASPSPRP